MATVKDGGRETVALPPYSQITVVAAYGTGRVTRLADSDGAPPVSFADVTSTSLVGPFGTPTRHRIEALGGDLTYTIAPVDFPTAAESATAAAALYIPVGGAGVGDLKFYSVSGVPVDYTDGTPPATGEAEAGIGSLAVNILTGKWYTNGGTKAQPIWKIITSAS